MARTKVLHLACRDVRPIGWIIRQSPEVLFELLGGVADHLVEQDIAGVVAIEADHRRIAINRARHAPCAAGAAWIGVHLARSAERRVGREWDGTCRSRRSPYR